MDFTPTEMLRTPQYYLLFAAIMFIYPAYQLVNPQLVSLCTAKGLSPERALSAVGIASALVATLAVLLIRTDTAPQKARLQSRQDAAVL